MTAHAADMIDARKHYNRREPVAIAPIAVPVAPKPLRATDCKTTADWEQWARERREYDDPYGYSRERY